MKKHIKQSIWYVTLTLFMLSALRCTSEFKDLNTNPAGITDEQAGADFALVAASLAQGMRDIIPEDVGEYQLTNNLASDCYSGFMGAQNNFAGNLNNMTYSLVEGWYQATWNDRYIKGMNPLYRVLQLTRNDQAMQDIYALALTLRVAAMHRTADKVGPIIYSKYSQPNAQGGIEYDDLPQVYERFFLELDTAGGIFSGIMGNAPSPAISKSDVAYSGNNYSRWLKFVNTLRLRLAVRIALVDPAQAKLQGEKALDPENGGLLSDNSDNCFVTLSVNHPLNIISSPTDWSDIRMGAPMESFLKGYKDPRLSKYFSPAKDPAVAGQYKGVRSGIDIDGKGRYNQYSELATLPNRMQLMVAAESWFLRAEAGLRGWANAGDVKGNYEMGIDKSFEMHGLSASAAAYKNDGVSKPAEYIDPKALSPGQNDVKNGSPYLSTMTIKWDPAATNDKKLERIITQKWLAIFPDGDEAWAEYRRTGYPVLFPNVVNYSNGAIPTIPGVRRIPYPQREYNSNRAAVTAAVGMLGGADNGGTRLWWDVADKGF